MRIDLEALRERDDKGVAAVRDLRESEKWAALETLIRDLKLRPLTQVNVVEEKVRAFRRETETR